MITITSDQVNSKILSLFHFTKPTIPRAFNVLEGITRGDILVDDITHPTSAVVRESIFGMLYFGGRMDALTMESLVAQFRQTGNVGISCWLDNPIHDLIPLNPDYDGRTLYFGVVILHEGKVVCETATGAPTHGRIEVGVTTAEEHRRRGLATIACTRLIGMCEAQGYATWWDCAKQNLPSKKLAHKLGYYNEREYRYIWWEKLI